MARLFWNLAWEYPNINKNIGEISFLSKLKKGGLEVLIGPLKKILDH